MNGKLKTKVFVSVVIILVSLKLIIKIYVHVVGIVLVAESHYVLNWL